MSELLLVPIVFVTSSLAAVMGMGGGMLLIAMMPGVVPAAGAWLGSGVYQSLDMHWLPALIGVLILVFTWVPMPGIPGRGQLALALLGFFQTGLGMVAGATGPVGAAVLLRRNSGRD